MKRVFKTVFWTGITAFAVLIIGFFLLWKFLPEKKIIALVESRSAAAGFPVRIESFAWSLPARFDIREIRVWNGDWQTAENVPFLSLDRLTIRCRILPLLRRRLDIAEVKIEGPKVTLDSSFFNMQAGSVKEKQPASLRPLPLSFRLLRLNAGPFTLKFDIPLKQGRGEVVLGGLNLDVSGITIPRKWLESPQAVRGWVRMFAENAFCDIRLPGNTLKLIPELEARFGWTKDRRWSLNTRAGIFSMGRDKHKLAFLLSLLGTGYGDSVRIEESLVSLGGAELARFSGGSARSGGTLRFHVKADGIPADLGALIQAAGAYLPDSTAQWLSSYDVQGRWNPIEGEITGDLRQGQFHFGSRLEHVGLSSESPPLSFKNGSGFVFASGRFKEKGLENGTVAGKAFIDGLSARINDTLTFSTGKILSEIRADLDWRFQPATGRGSGTITDLFGGRAALTLNWNTPSGEAFDPGRLNLMSELRVDSLDTGRLPNAPKNLKGFFHGLVTLKTNGLENMRLTAAIKTKGVRYTFEGKPDTTPPFMVQGMALGGMKKPYHTISLDTLLLRCEDFFLARGSGKADLKNAEYQLSIRSARLENAPLVRFFPKRLSGESMKGLRLSGGEILTAMLRVRGSGKNAGSAVEGRLVVAEAGMAIPEQAVGVEGVEGEIGFQGDLNTIRGNGSLLVRSIFLDQMRNKPIENSWIGFKAEAKLPDSVRIGDGFIEVPSLFTKGRFSFGLGRTEAAKPRMNMSFDAAFQSPDSLEIVRGVTILGEARGSIQLNSLDRRFRLSGTIRSDSLSVFQRNIVEVKNITCRVPIDLIYDAGTARLVRSVSPPRLTWTAYETDRERLRESETGLETVRIEKVVVEGYSIGHIVLDLTVRDALVDVPYFSADLLGGNIGGSMRIDPKSGLPQDVTYAVRAQASRINSAMLRGMEIPPGQETELDASLWFTGRGLDMNKPEWEGSFHITQIGPQFAGTLLQQMDPQGSDRSIRLTRRLLSAGWKPKLFSFELRHGYVYPSLMLAQPWFFPLRIPDKVEYGRLPLEFFLKQKNMFQLK